MPTVAVQIKRFFQEGLEKSKASMKISPQNIFLVLALILIFTVALVIRLAPVFNGVFLLKAFDPHVQYRCTQYMVDNGFWAFFNWHDLLSWYPEGHRLYNLFPGLIVTNAIFYWVLTGLGFQVTVYEVVFYSPAFMGAVTCIVMFFLGKEVLDKRTGLIAAFFLALSPGFMQRTVAGFFDNETVGVFATLMSLLFFIRSVKKGSVIDGLVGGLSLGYLTLSWGAYTYITLLIPFATALMILFKKYSTRLFIAYTTVIGTALVIHSFFRRITTGAFFDKSDLFIPMLFLFALPVVEYLYRKKEYNPAWYRSFWRALKKLIVPGIVIGGVALWLLVEFGDVSLLNVTGRQLTLLNPFFRDTFALVASVGEHMPSAWAVFYFNTLVPLIFVVPGIFFAYKRGNESDIITIIFVLTLYYFTGSMIRIILLFSPAVALMGAYGISQILRSFSAIARRQDRVQRRRRREAKQMLDKSAGTVLFLFVGGLFLAQTLHATDVAATQLPWSEQVAGGQFYDWQEAFTWMKTNLNSGTVVVSWWDYGYWMTTNGNVTTVNDNATINSTRIGLTGMAMMTNDELESAKILRGLNADYVLVYFGHLVSGLGGDEGKWPWMVKICNDHSAQYASYPFLQPQTWYRPPQQFPDAPQVFNYGAYINESSGLYRPDWFNSQLVRMMFYQEPLDTSKATTQLNYWTAREIAGDGQSREPRKDDNGKTWLSYFQDPDYFNFKVFQKAFFSGNTTVKIFKVDYTAIDSEFQVGALNVYDNGFGNVLVNNTGITDLNITRVRFQGATTYHDAFSVEGTNLVIPGEAKEFWFNTGFTGANRMGVGDAKTMLVTARAGASDNPVSLERSSSTTVKNATVHADIGVSINRAGSAGQAPDVMTVQVDNTGNVSVNLKEILVGSRTFNRSRIIPVNQSFAIPAGSSRQYQVTIANQTVPYLVGDAVDITVRMVDGFEDSATISFQTGQARLAFDATFTARPEVDLIRDEAFLRNYALVNFTAPGMTPTRTFLPVDPATSIAYTNGSMVLRVKNTGATRLGLDEVRINGTTFNNWVLAGGQSNFMDPGDVRTIRVTYDDGPLALDAPQDVQVLGIDQVSGNVVAADGAIMKAVAHGEAVKILTENLYTFGFTNETVAVTIKNVGTVSTTLSRLSINGTTILLNDSMVLLGSRTLGVQESCVIRLAFSKTAIADFNSTDTMHLRVNTTTNVHGEASITATINPLVRLNMTASATVTGQQVNVVFRNTGTAGRHVNATVGMVKIEAKGEATWYTPSQFGEIAQLPPATPNSWQLGILPNAFFTWSGSQDLAAGDLVTITIFSAEGGEFSKTITVSA